MHREVMLLLSLRSFERHISRYLTRVALTLTTVLLACPGQIPAVQHSVSVFLRAVPIYADEGSRQGALWEAERTRGQRCR